MTSHIQASEETKVRHRKHRSNSGSEKTKYKVPIDYKLLNDKIYQLGESFAYIQTLQNDVEDQIQSIHSHIKKELDQNCNSSTSQDTKGKSLESMRKTFTNRASLLSDLFKNKDIDTIRHVFIAVMIIFAMQHLVFGIFEGDRSLFDMKLIYWCFHKISAVMVIWVQMQMLAFMLYIVYFQWKSWRSTCVSLKLVKYFDILLLILYICYMCFFIAFPLKMLIRERPGLASATIMLLEQLRMLMKQHAFVRENIPLTLKGNESPDFSKYLYFLFAPTLIYRDSYPRNSKIRWNFVLSCFSEFAATIMYSYYVFLRVSAPEFNSTDESLTNLKSFSKTVYSCILPGSLLLLLVFYGFFHCWLNMFAEMLMFADRMFYKDWWNCTSYRSFFRKWNMVVYDWLFNYVYLDCLWLFGYNRRLLCSFIVVTISSIFHEYIFTFMFGYFYPVNLVLFGFFGFIVSTMRISEDSKIGNILFWVSFIFGLGINVSLCSMGWHARKLCGEKIGPLWDVILPKYLICIGWNPQEI